MPDPLRHQCGCVNAVHAPSGVMMSVVKCRGHLRGQRDPAGLGRAYFEELGSIRDGIPQCGRLCEELVEALGEFDDAREAHEVAMEIGPGVSLYAPLFIRRGFVFAAIEPSHWAAEWNRNAYRCKVVETAFERYDLRTGFCRHIIAAHSIEHMDDAPGAIVRCAEMLVPGGEFWVIVPDDSDPVNPDHLWFFDAETLRGCVESAGLVVDRLEVRRRVPRENFLYARARKP